VCTEIWDFEIKVDLCFSFACLIDQTRCLLGKISHFEFAADSGIQVLTLFV
jgi:hypothetical protein